ncbi:MAG: oxygenase MpaB family protein [Solirubrobacterales bacterium]
MAADDGYFPEGSILRRVHSERSVGLMYGQRALMIGALNPLTYVGTYEHTAGRLTPFKRLARTAEKFETIFFGTRDEADRVLEGVHRLHQPVQGTLKEAAGPHPAGSSYSAFDPELMLWTMAAIADSGPYFFELFVRPLTPDERERLWQEYVRFGELFGMPREVAPKSSGEFREYFDGFIASDRAHLTDSAREVGHATALRIPLPTVYGPFKRVHDLIMLGSLPEVVRRHYCLSWSRSQEAAFRAAVASVRVSRPITPGRIRYGSNTDSFRLVARTERRRIERREPTPQAL